MTDQDMNTTGLNIVDPTWDCDLAAEKKAFQYPKIRRDLKVVDVFHGTQEVSDPYRHLEDSSRHETREFIEEQKELFESFILKSHSRALIRKKLTEIWNHPKIGVPMKKGSRYFFWENSGLQNHSVLHVKEALDGKARVLLDPNAFDKEGKFSVTTIGISPSGQYVGYTISDSGSDWTTIKVRDVTCGHDLDDNIRNAKLTAIRWTKENKGFFYQRFPVPFKGYGRTSGTEISINTDAKVYYHEIGTLQADDTVVVEFPDNPGWTIGTEMSDSGDYLFIHASNVIGERNLFYANLKEGYRTKVNLISIMEEPGSHWYLANDDTTVYFVTNVGAPNYQVVSFDLKNPGKKNWKVIVPERKKDVIDWASVVNNNKLVICYCQDMKSQIQILDLKTGSLIQQVSVEAGTASGSYGRRIDDDLFIHMESYINPGKIYRIHFQDDGKINMTIYKESQNKSVDISNTTMTQFSYSSDDGTNIPVFLIHRKDMPLDSNRPCILTSYGGFFTSTLPLFNPSYIFFAEHFKGVVAIATIRGGGEFGKQWWNDGRLLNKQNGFDDFISGARFLLHNGYTRPSKLAALGSSNGGLLVGAVVNQRPDLFGAAIPQVGIMDMLRFHKFTIGHLWCGEYGSPEDETYFSYLKSYSPLHNIRLPKDQNVQYPSILVTTADHDDRVVPSHSYKYIAELQHTIGSSPRQTNPLLIRIDTKSGHGYGKPTSKKIEEKTDIFAFLERVLGYSYQSSKIDS